MIGSKTLAARSAACAMTMLMAVSAARAIAGPLDTAMIEAGHLPADVRAQTSDPSQITLRAVREYAPCLRLHVRQNQPWTLVLGSPVRVTPNKTHTAAIAIASAVEAGQSQTSDIANFRLEKQPKAPGDEQLDASRNGAGELLVVSAADEARILARQPFSPGNWNVVSAAFDVPPDVQAVSLRLTSPAGAAGVFFVADADVAEGTSAPVLFRPDDSTLPSLQGEETQFATLISPGQKYGLYSPGQTISWTIARPSNSAFARFGYRVLDPLGNELARGQSEFGRTVEYHPADVGYYELAIVSRSSADPSRALHDWQGAAVLAPVGPFAPGQTAFGMQCAPHELMKIVGATWDRQGLVGWTNDINELDHNHDFDERIASFRDNGVLPLHHQNNITPNTNAYPPGRENELPSDLANYEQAYRKLASLGGNFVEHFEFWNEPEGRLGASPHWTIENIAKTVQAAHRGMKSANPNAKLAIGNNLDLVAGIQKHAGSDCFEMVTLHPYPWALGGAWNTPEEGLLLEASISARQWLDDNDGKHKQLWSTEYGYTTGTTEGGCSFLQQAQMNVRATLLQLGGGYDKVNPFRADDVWDWGQVDGRFGLCLENLTPKPSLVAYAAMIRAIGDLKFVGRFDAPKNLAAFVFGNDAESVVAIWTDREDHAIEINLPAGGKRIDLFGRATDLPPGTHQIIATQSAQYLLVPQPHAAFASAQPQMKFLAGLHGGVFDANVKRKTYPIPILTDAPPRLDGDLSEWQGPAMELADRSEDFTSEVRAAFCGDALYVAAHVRGRTPGKNPQSGINIWDGDCVEVYFSRESDNRPIGYYREIDKHIGIAPGVDGSIGQAANIVPNHPPALPGAEVRYKPNDAGGGGYDLEARIPLKLLDVVEPVRPGDAFAFDIQISVGNPDGLHRRHQATWSGTSQNHLNPFAWGNAQACPATIPPPDNPVQPATPPL